MARKAAPRRGPEDAAGKKKRLVLFGCSGLLALVLLIALIVYLKVHAGPALPREVQRRMAEPGGSAPAAAPSGASGEATRTAGSAPAATGYSAIPGGTPPLRQQLAQLEYAGRVGDARPQTLYITDAELNAVLVESFKADEQLRQIRAYFSGGKAYLVALVNWKGQALNVTVATEPIIVNGGLQFAVQSVSVGSFAAPAAITERIQREANKNSGKLDAAHLGLYVDRVDVRNGVAILSGRAVAKTQ